MKNSKRKGFTLIEVIITLLIIVMIATFGIRKYSAIQEDAKVKIDIAAARQIGDTAELALIEQPDLNTENLKKAVEERIKYPTPTSKEYGGNSALFVLTVSGRVITVKANGVELYPDFKRKIT